MTVLLAPMGGLGNMLFQVAAGRELAQRRGDTLLVLPPATARDRANRGRLWNAIGEELPEAPPRLAARVDRAAGRSRSGRGISIVSQKASRAFWPPGEWESLHRVVVLRGYFQHPGYFGRQPEVLAVPLRAWSEASLAGPAPDVAIHLRRGDYLMRGWQLPVEWYERAIRILVGEVVGPCAVAIVSDDPLAAEGLAARLGRSGAGQGWTFAPAEGGSSAADFALLASARHLVMSNSTFSWWAGLVGDHSLEHDAKRRVVVPGQWLGTRDHDLLRPGWTRLDPEAAGPGA